MTYQEKKLTEIAKSLAEISKTLKQMHADSKQEAASIQTAGDDCSRCQCGTCENRTTCKMKQDEILSDIMASPCNGCKKGQRYMPIESAHCPDYK